MVEIMCSFISMLPEDGRSRNEVCGIKNSEANIYKG